MATIIMQYFIVGNIIGCVEYHHLLQLNVQLTPLWHNNMLV